MSQATVIGQPTAAVIGAGPAGFFCAVALLRGECPWRVDLYERLPVPYGLVRYGVAPDHPEIKAVSRQFDRVAGNSACTFLGNIEIGRDVSVDELCRAYDAVILACGAPEHRRLEIPGESLPGSLDATRFVGWYNGHPDYAGTGVDVSSDTAVVVGNGNVAIDAARILAKSNDELRETDIASNALEVLRHSGIRTIHILGRRGPVQSSFSTLELRELAELAEFAPASDPSAFLLDAAGRTELETLCDGQQQRAFGVLESYSGEQRDESRPGRLQFHFLCSPIEFQGDERVTGLRVRRNRLEGEPGRQHAVATEEEFTIECGLVIRCIGYRAVPIPGAPFDESGAVVSNQEGRVLEGEAVIPGLYVAGWLKHGPRGLIGLNKKESSAVIAKVMEDLPRLPRKPGGGPKALRQHLQSRGVRITSFDDWTRIDTAEKERGKSMGKSREKFRAVREMLACLDVP